MTSAFNHSLLYAREKLSGAVNCLATHPGRLQERLPDAWRFNLIHLRRENLPDDETWSRLEKLGREFRRVEDAYYGSAVASMRRRRNSTVIRLAKEIVDLKWVVDQEIDRQLGEAGLL